MQCEKKHEWKRNIAAATKRYCCDCCRSNSVEKGKAFCERAFALHRQQHGKDKQNIEFAPRKSSCGRPCFWLEFFQISGIFPTCFGCFLLGNTTNENIWIIEILINHFFAIFKVSRPETFETETRKNGSRDVSRDRLETPSLQNSPSRVIAFHIKIYTTI